MTASALFFLSGVALIYIGAFAVAYFFPINFDPTEGE